MSAPDVPHVRTPEERFDNLPGFPYEPHYIQYGNLRMAYIDEKTGDGGVETFLCLHGQPTWSYLYRKMIPVLLNFTTFDQNPSRRVIAPDLLGFGRSDKPTRDPDYTFNFHRDALLHLVRTLDLTNVTLVVQDWGGLLGLTLPMADPSRYKRLLVMNTALATGGRASKGFMEWRAFNNRNPDLKIGELMKRGCKHLSKAETDAYDAPFPSIDYKGGVRRFPNLVMIEDGMEGVDISKKSMHMYRTTDMFAAADVFMACGQQDQVLGPPTMKMMSRVWKNGCFYTELEDAGHFVQEWGHRVAELAISVFEKKGYVEGVRSVRPPKASS